ncbi:hypothetical protein [Allosphingosinicella sp.]|jgi:hypothetical protein|uniref:hypothetical protein n=1 Tax=Allosphingosinicella sp. TaxID=2823234 RepID=UPI002F06D707
MANRGILQRLLEALGLSRAPAPAPAPTPALPPPPPAAHSVNLDDERIPESSRERAAAILGLVADLQERAARRGLQTELRELDRISSVHLPRLLESYIEIPPEHRAEVFRETGRSASFMLNERLDKMTQRLREISKMLARDNLNAFSTNLQFVDRQYGLSESPFD